MGPESCVGNKVRGRVRLGSALAATVNEWADKLCGGQPRRSSTKCTSRRCLDDLSRQVSLFLAQRAEMLLQAKGAPELCLKQNPSKKFEKGRRQGPKPKQLNQHRPGEDGGLNKLERLKLLVQDRSKGHDWYWNQAQNPSISCRNCNLYIEQISGLDKFGLLEKHTCRHCEVDWNPLLPKHPSHDMYNLGHMWVCKGCYRTHRPGGATLQAKLKEPCTKSGKLTAVAKLLPQDPKQAGIRNLFSQPAPSQPPSPLAPEACPKLTSAATLPQGGVASLGGDRQVAAASKQETEAAPKSKAKAASKSKAKKEAMAATQKITSFFK